MSYELIHGDSLQVLPTIEDEFDCCITDPPYSAAFVGKFYNVLKKYQDSACLSKKRDKNTWNWLGIPGYWSENYYRTNDEFENFTALWMKEIHRLLLPGAFLACFCCHKLIHVNVNLALKSGFFLRDIFIWKYASSYSKGMSLSRIGGNNSHKTLTSGSYEPILIFQKQTEGNHLQNYVKYGTGFIDTSIIKNNIIELAKPTKKEKGDNPHYSVKPISLIEVLCRGLMCKKIIDSFMGSGTVGEVCVKNNIDYVGIEIEHDFHEFARDRLNELAIGGNTSI